MSTCHDDHPPWPLSSSRVVRRDLIGPRFVAFLQTDEAVSDASGICSIRASGFSQTEIKDFLQTWGVDLVGHLVFALGAGE